MEKRLISEENKKNQKDIKKIIVRLKNMLRKCVEIYFLFVILLFFQKIKWCFNNNKSFLCMTNLAVHKAFIILIKHHFIF